MFLALDPYCYQTDQPASALLPVTTWRNLVDTGQVRHAGAAYAPDPARRHAVSTPSDIWRAIPIRVYVDASTTTIGVTVRLIAALAGASAGTDALDLRLVTPTDIGAEVTVQTDAAAQDVALSALYTGRGSELVDCEVQVRSIRGATAAMTGIAVDNVTESGLSWAVDHTTGSLVVDQPGHYECVVIDWPLGMPVGRTSWHVGRIETHSSGTKKNWWVWPSSTQDLVSPADVTKLGGEADLYPLGTATVHSISTWSSGDGNAARGVNPVLLLGDTVMRSSAWVPLHRAVLSLRARGRVWATGPWPGGSAECWGYPVAVDDPVQAAIVERRSGSDGILIAVRLVVPSASALDTVTLTATAGSATVTLAMPAYPTDDAGSPIEPGYDANRLDTSELLHGVLRWGNGERAGWRDLAGAGESYVSARGWCEGYARIAWSDTGAAVGDSLRLEVTCGSAAHVVDVTILEV